MQLRDQALRKALAGAAAVTAALTATGAAHSPSPTTSPVRKPPASMSTVGGEQLGRPGPQVGAGAPALPKGLSSLSWIVSDADSGEVLAAQNPHWQLPPASTLKTLFADTVLPKFPQTATHKVLNSDFDGMGSGSSMVGVMPGQTYKVSDLWLGVFLRSGNDAVHVLSAMNGGVAATVAEMQARAAALGARDTRVISPDGYDMPGQVSSAYDLTLFARDGLKNPDFARYCSTAVAHFPGGPSTKGKPFEIDNTNRLLTGFDGVGGPYPGVIGVKNGYTTNAGNTLIEGARRDGHTLLVTLMNPQAPVHDEVYKEARALLDWGFSAEGRTQGIGTLDAVRSIAAQDAATPTANAKAPWAGNSAAAKSGGYGLSTYAGLGAMALALLCGLVAFRRNRVKGRRARGRS